MRVAVVTAWAAPDAPVEWWERLSSRWVTWLARHPTAVHRLLVVRAIVLWVALVVVVVAVVAVPRIRPGLQAAVWCWWILLVWFVLARTRTMTWRLFAGLFSLSVPWSLAVGFLTTRLADGVGGVGSVGASVGIAGVAEESLKLVPLAILALSAPGRVSRFAVVDWLLAGIASGTAYLLVEETARAIGTGPSGGLRDTYLPGPYGIGWSPFSGGLATGPAMTAGHQVHTALVTVMAGLAVAWFRYLYRRRGPLRGLAFVVVLLPLFTWWIAVSDHTALNQAAADLDPAGGGSSVPHLLGLTWVVTGHGAGRAGLLLALFVLAQVVDARALARGGAAAELLPDVAWSGVAWAVRIDRSLAGTAVAVAERSTRVLAGPIRLVTTIVGGVVLWTGLAWRDVAVVVAAHGRPAGARVRFTTVRVGLARGRATALLVRAVRENAYGAAWAPTRRRLRFTNHLWRIRLCAVVVVGVLFVLAIPVSASLAHTIGPTGTATGQWLAGYLANIGAWWDSLDPGTQLLIGFAGAALLALIPGVGFGAALFVAGMATYFFEHADDLADLIRDPEGTVRDYVSTATPLSIALDVAEAVLTFLPEAGGAVVGRLLRGAVARFFARRGLVGATTVRDLATTVPYGTEEALHLGSVDPAVAKTIVRRHYPGLEDVNAERWAKRESGYIMNCTSCAVATARRLAGGTGVARKITSATDIHVISNELGGSWERVFTYDRIVREVKAGGMGTRAIVFAKPARRVGHVFNVIYDSNGVVFLDGQTGTLARLPRFTLLKLLILP